MLGILSGSSTVARCFPINCICNRIIRFNLEIINIRQHASAKLAPSTKLCVTITIARGEPKLFWQTKTVGEAHIHRSCQNALDLPLNVVINILYMVNKHLQVNKESRIVLRTVFLYEDILHLCVKQTQKLFIVEAILLLD